LVGVTAKNLLLHRSKVNYCSGESLGGFQYQNLNFALIGQILGKQTGESWEELVHTLFLEAEMRDTFLHSDFPEREFFDRLGASLKMLDRDLETMRMTVMTKAENAAGGIVSTARDLLRWNKFLVKNEY
jgi:CubicO group peptidase (beta-lactamase class C family)